MKLFLDTANATEIARAASLGVIAGVTTNPSLIAKEGRHFQEVVSEIAGLVDGPISAEVVSQTAAEMVPEAQGLAAIHPNITIKVPIGEEGLKAVRQLTSMGIKTNVTLVFSANQALLAALAGATYVSPFVGRMDDVGQDGLQVVRQVVDIYSRYGYHTQVIAASIRHPLHVQGAAQAGAHIATIPYQVLTQMLYHPLTDVGLEKFLADWQRVPKG